MESSLVKKRNQFDKGHALQRFEMRIGGGFSPLLCPLSYPAHTVMAGAQDRLRKVKASQFAGRVDLVSSLLPFTLDTRLEP